MPRKAVYKELESSQTSLEFELFLCEKLGFKTLADLRREMSSAEFLIWATYYARKAQQRELERMRAGGQ